YAFQAAAISGFTNRITQQLIGRAAERAAVVGALHSLLKMLRKRTFPAADVMSAESEKRSGVRYYVQEPSKWIANIEASHTPSFSNGTVFDSETGSLHAVHRFIQVINFDRQIRYGCPGAAFDGDTHLRRHFLRRGESDDPAQVHNSLKSADIAVELTSLC